MPDDSKSLTTTLESLYAEVWNEHLERNHPEEIFHYTSANGVCGILTKKILFASDLFFLNDATEGRYGKSIIEEVLRTKTGAAAESLLAGFQEEPLFRHSGEEWSIYSVSFCGTKDLLGQWHGYGSPAGYAVGLKLDRLLNDARKNFAIHRMLYDPAKQRQVIDSLISGCLAAFDEFRSPGREGVVLNEIATYLITSMFNLKHSAFRGEDEWRILLLETYNNPQYPVRYRTVVDRIVPYVEVSLLPDWVSTVVVGPNATRYPNEQAIARMLVTEKFVQAKCEVSGIPLRG
jgi:hypothetical protein